MGKINKKPINIYWATPENIDSLEDWSFLYPKPKTLFSELSEQRVDPKNTESYFFCPSVSKKFKKTLVFKNSINSSYEYNENMIQNISEIFLSAKIIRMPAILSGPTIDINLFYYLFSEEPLEISVTPPYFHEPKYMKHGSVMPGQFDIGQWFRPITFEIQTWKNEGEFHLIEGEPLFYLEFKTDRPIILNRFILTQRLKQYEKANIKSKDIFGPLKPLQYRYEKFMSVGYKEKVLTEIHKNLINEEPYKF